MVKNSNQSAGFFNIYTLGMFSVVSLIGIFVLTNTDNQSKIITNQDFSIYQNKQIYNQILSTNIEQDFYNKIYELLVKESNGHRPSRRINDSGVSHPVMQSITERSSKPMVFESKLDKDLYKRKLSKKLLTYLHK
jgi:hypothetical protein